MVHSAPGFNAGKQRERTLLPALARMVAFCCDILVPILRLIGSRKIDVNLLRIGVFSIALSDRADDSPMPRSLGCTKSQQCLVAHRKGALRAHSFHAERLENRSGNRASKRRGNRIADLARTMPLGLVETKPIWEAMQARHLPNGDTPVPLVMDRARASESSPCGVRAGSEGITYACWRELEKPRNWLNFARSGLAESFPRQLGVLGSHA